MNNFNGKGRDKKRSYGGGNRDGARPDMHKVVCSDCGKNCEVPFRPSGDKPVFCSTCFEKQGGGPSRDKGPRNFEDRSYKPSFNSRPTYGKPPYRSTTSSNTENYKAQFDELNSKLDRILRAIDPLASEKTQPEQKSFSKKKKY